MSYYATCKHCDHHKCLKSCPTRQHDEQCEVVTIFSSCKCWERKQAAESQAGEVEALINGVIDGDPVTIAKHGEPVAVMVSYDTYKEMTDAVEGEK